ncbi:tetratricopeptide repeat protein [Streptomyces sp. NPDC000070]|uniref:tetratricopeptide repeat protein n=1 Tax=Streptomyces sp. NPDC000070 TaxID=3154240 RepID=UPI00332CAE35
MLDPISLGAIGAVLGAVGSGMANEAGRWAWESAGGLVRRITGREVPAPTTHGQVDDVAHLVHERIRDHPELARAWADFARGVRGTPGIATAAHRPSLPTAPRSFTNREQALKLLDKEATRPFEGRPRLALLHGPEGIGTSTLAVHWGWRQSARFPDGQLHADLRTLAPEAVAGTLLRQLGMPEAEIPPSAEDRTALFRRCLTDRRLLLVLDHARSAAQVKPLLVAAPDVVTIVVARQPLIDLGALRIPVGPLARRDAVRLLTTLAGKPAVAAARATLPAVLDRCAGSPYALCAAAPRLADPPAPSTEAAVHESDPVLTAAEDSYRRLTPGAARLYRLAGLHDWPDLDAAAAARAADVDEAEAVRHLEELAGALLVEQTGTGRFRYRPAVRAHAERTAAAVDGIATCSASVSRVVGHYRDLAVGAARAALPQSWRVPAAPSPVSYPDPGAAVAALAAEARNLVSAVRAAGDFGDRDTVTLLCQALWPLQLKAGHHDVLLPALRTGTRIADAHVPGSRTAGALHAQLAHTLTELRRWDEAESEAEAAAREERAAGHARGHASAVEFLGLLRLRQWRFGEAYACFEEAGRILDGIGPGDEGAADLPRARALLERHRGRALRGLGRREEAVAHLERALGFFRSGGSGGEAYNAARALTDLAETHLDGGAPEAALPLIDEALAALARENATYHVAHLRALRERCVTPE